MPDERVMIFVEADLLELLIAAYSPVTVELRDQLVELTDNIRLARLAR
jgi:hypothetical protein